MQTQLFPSAVLAEGSPTDSCTISCTAGNVYAATAASFMAVEDKNSDIICQFLTLPSFKDHESSFKDHESKIRTQLSASAIGPPAATATKMQMQLINAPADCTYAARVHACSSSAADPLAATVVLSSGSTILPTTASSITDSVTTAAAAIQHLDPRPPSP